MERLKEWVAQTKEQYGDELAQAESLEENWAYAEVLAILDAVIDFLEEDYAFLMERLKEWVAQKKEQYGDELAQAESREEKWAYAEVLAILDEVSDFLEED